MIFVQMTGAEVGNSYSGCVRFNLTSYNSVYELRKICTIEQRQVRAVHSSAPRK